MARRNEFLRDDYNQNQLDSILMFLYNIGGGENFAKSETDAPGSCHQQRALYRDERNRPGSGTVFFLWQ